jgi:hypothetical protein
VVKNLRSSKTADAFCREWNPFLLAAHQAIYQIAPGKTDYDSAATISQSTPEPSIQTDHTPCGPVMQTAIRLLILTAVEAFRSL